MGGNNIAIQHSGRICIDLGQIGDSKIDSDIEILKSALQQEP